MGFEEKDVYAVLGLDAPAEQPEVAAPAAQTGGNESAVTAPTGAGANETSGTGDGGEIAAQARTAPGPRRGPADGAEGVSGPMWASAPTEASHQWEGSAGSGGDGPSGTPVPTGDDGGEIAASASPPRNDKEGEMSKEERARQAAARRKREQDAVVEAAVRAEREKLQAAHKAELEEVFSQAGMTDRYNDGKPIRTMEEFRSWSAKAQAAGLSRRLQEGKLTPEDLQAAVDNAPAVKAAKAAMEKLAQQQREQEQARYREEVEKELAQIRQLDPSVTGLSDILNREGGEEFSRLVQKNGLSFLEAFKLSNGERLAKAQAMAAAEGAARKQHGKDHMRSVVSGGGSVLDVPRETVAFYRQLNPEMSMEDIQKDYAKWMPGKK